MIGSNNNKYHRSPFYQFYTLDAEAYHSMHNKNNIQTKTSQDRKNLQKKKH
jgi:hypothetical protein